MDEPTVESIRRICNIDTTARFLRCSRSVNMVAHEIARYSFSKSCNLVFDDAIHLCLSRVVKIDMAY